MSTQKQQSNHLRRHSSASRRGDFAPGDIDSTFNPGTIGTSSILFDGLVQADGKIIIVGGFITAGGGNANRIARLNPNGSLDKSFNPGTASNSTVYFAEQIASSKVLVGGFFSTFNGIPKTRLVRLHNTGIANRRNPSRCASVSFPYKQGQRA